MTQAQRPPRPRPPRLIDAEADGSIWKRMREIQTEEGRDMPIGGEPKP